MADGRGESPRGGLDESKLLISLKCNIQKRQGRNQGPATATGFRKRKISTTLEGAKVFRLYTGQTTREPGESEAEAFTSSAGDAGREARK